MQENYLKRDIPPADSTCCGVCEKYYCRHIVDIPRILI